MHLLSFVNHGKGADLRFFRYLYRLHHKTKGLLLAALLGLLVLASIAGGIHRVRSVNGFLEGTQLNGEDVSGKPVQEVAGSINDKLVNAEVELTENDTTVLKGTLADFGHDFDEQAFLADLVEEEDQQKHDLSTTMKRLVESADFQLTDYYADDSAKLADFVVSRNFLVTRVASAQARIELNEDTELYEVVDPVQGNEIDDQKLQEYVEQVLDEAIANGTFLETPVLKISIPKDVYTSETVSTDTTALKKEALEKNRQILTDAFQDMTITYLFGSQTEVLEGTEIVDWIEVSDEMEVTISDEKVSEYVAALAAKYETRYCDRAFVANGGRIVHIPEAVNLYGYTINEEAECAALKDDILNRESVSREPVYIEADKWGSPLFYSRDGKDDINGTYIEVSVTRQHLWFYKEGTLIVESDVVTGGIDSNETRTIEGCYPLAYKASPATLTGENSVDFWSSEVDYWMAFNQGQGLHDAPWRSQFGGEIYKTDGSHGCVNLPTDVAGKIYENIEPGMAIIVYY